MPGDGYSYDRAGLDQVWAQIGDGERAMARAASKPIEAPDAGASSAAVASALAEVMSLAIGAQSVLSDISDKMHVTTGAYDEVENTSQGMVERQYWIDANSRVEPYKDRHGNPDDINPNGLNRHGGE